MEKIAILYGPKGGSTERVAHKIAETLGADRCTLLWVKGLEESDLSGYKYLIFGAPTVGTHNWSDQNDPGDWDLFLTRLHKMNLQGKVCAVYGLGDQVSYSFKFVDDIAVIADTLIENGATLVGKVSAEGYTFDESMAFRDDLFLGLPLDEDNEPGKTPERITRWVEQLKKEFS
ncbi:MAG: flavodoxin [Bacteroidales bacterium]|jgi:flavodoxin I|nr:flavodoxin [Bacteroidales bacterium]MDD2570273.1 flavodoxin [Bacteroidales bacterium]MDD2811956.1 flavodoxin [Bacteroidales bacterium]MDD3384333.1 flavodoxin [Bacteroidales bacterium]MDD3810708.1 flavodoxin [Bacteroidales bacterium]